MVPNRLLFLQTKSVDGKKQPSFELVLFSVSDCYNPTTLRGNTTQGVSTAQAVWPLSNVTDLKVMRD